MLYFDIENQNVPLVFYDESCAQDYDFHSLLGYTRKRLPTEKHVTKFEGTLGYGLDVTVTCSEQPTEVAIIEEETVSKLSILLANLPIKIRFVPVNAIEPVRTVYGTVHDTHRNRGFATIRTHSPFDGGARAYTLSWEKVIYLIKNNLSFEVSFHG